jgi:hypothetical protein
MKAPKEEIHPSPWLVNGITIALPVISFLVYFLSLSPSLSSQSDSGELVSAAALLGIAHPPGYPLYTLLGHLFSLLPLAGDAAFRLNIMSAFFSSLALAFIFHLGLLIFENLSIAVTVALLYAFSQDFWRLSLSAEVFSLHIFFVCLILFLLFRWRRAVIDGNEGRDSIFLLFFATGLACAHHHTILFIAPACLYLVIKDKMYRPLAKPRTLIFSLLFFAGGLLPYIYLPLRAAAHPPVCWGDAASPHGFLRIVTRAGYGTFALGAISGRSWTPSQGLEQSLEYVKILASQFTPLLFPIGIAGAILMGLKRRVLFSFFFFIFLIYGILFLLVARFPTGEGFMALLSRFFLPSHLVFALFIGAAFAAMERILTGVRKKVFSIIIILVPLLLLMLNYPLVNRRSDYVARDYGRNLLRSLNQNAIIFMLGDVPCGALLYCQKVEGTRPDVTPLFEGLLGSPWYREKIARETPDLGFLIGKEKMTTKQFVLTVMEHEKGRRSIYFNHPVEEVDIPVTCHGLAWKARMGPPSENDPAETLLDGYYAYTGDYHAERLPYFSRELLKMYSLSYLCLASGQEARKEKKKALQSLEKALKMDPENVIAYKSLGNLQIEEKLWDRAETTFVTMSKKGGPSPEVYTNLAIIYAQRGEHEKAKEALRKAREAQGIRK